ncbi:hypothetical protein A1O1_02289 [Capronia coronata CBS 617.96]|uniref:RING-type domain-containing protein n=1 Tax=Capronia coronata CBS 617.96 TaxID=1182541 RepID=W9YXB5_9EURO|nr:uncharacterized protein A1O1_02289 [Capronia coronata CBS 617.96]EXJ93896.1 hypothetical protein A1O1_02289 [Capronia coronata CBS 617.96]
MQIRLVSEGWLAIVLAWLSLVSVGSFAQTIGPSNATQDLEPVATSPRFILNGSELAGISAVPLAPVGPETGLSHDYFVQLRVQGHLVNVDASNANDISGGNQFSYLSCDPESYTGNLDAGEVFRIVVNSPSANLVILYSETSNHCLVTGLSNLPNMAHIFTTTDPTVASRLAALDLSQNSPGVATLLPDLHSYTNFSSGSSGSNGNNSPGQSPTTAVAMIILYSITGIITALFVVIIVTGAVRAHRHPERYGPRNIIGRGRQSRARGIARAMLETLPIVKFGDPVDLSKKPAEGADIEMNAGNTADPTAAEHTSSDKSAVREDATAADSGPGGLPVAIATSNADGTDAEGHLGCSICTEDFKKGEEVRVLPCNHKFHPDCVDPWLLNVSGTCPLCRTHLRPQTQDTHAEGEGEGEAGERRSSGATLQAGHDGQYPPPLPGAVQPDGSATRHGRRVPIAHLRSLVHVSREDRIAALQRLRQETLQSGSPRPTDDERSGLTRRFRERFRIRTERRGTVSE